MILLIDIGNAYIKVGKAELSNNKYFLKEISYIDTKETLVNFEKSNFFQKIINSNNFKFIIVASVVKKISEKILALNNPKIIFFSTLMKKIFENMKLPEIPLKDINISEVGEDILSMYYYFINNSVSENKLIYSLGTANVALYIENNFLQGCLISLGLEPSAKEISNYCSLINDKNFKFDSFSFPVKQDTKTAIEDGSLYQTAGFCELITNSYQFQKPICYLTGGNAKHVSFLLSKKYIKIGNLVLKGLLKYLNDNINYF